MVSGFGGGDVQMMLAGTRPEAWAPQSVRETRMIT